MKVLMLGNDPSVKGGITSVISQLLSHDWNADGIEMKFIPTYIEANNVKKILFFANAYKKIEKEFKSNRPDMVHIHMSYKGSFTRKYHIHKLCKKYGIPDIIHLHGSEFKKWYDESDKKKNGQIRTLLKECSRFIVLGEKWNQTVMEIEPETKILVVSNTVQILDYNVQWAEPFIVLFMGVLIQRKGVADLIDAVKLLKDSYKMNNMKIIIAGSGVEEDKLKKQCSDYGLDDCIEFAGWTAGEKKLKLFKESQMLVLPSYNEGLPIAVLEAISYGMPVVATDVGDISSAVIDGKNGYLIQSGDTNALADAVFRVCESEEYYKKMSKASRNLAETMFSDRNYFEQLKKCYLSSIGEKCE